MDSAQELRERLRRPLVPLSGDERATMDRVLEHYRHLPAMVWWRVPELILLRRVEYQWPLLDLGCGDGRMAEVMFGGIRRVTLGLDLSRKDTGRARRSGSYEAVIRGDLCGALPIRDDRFQTVFSNSVFEHVPKVDRLFPEIRRILRPGGRLVFTVPSEHLNSMLRWPQRIRALFGDEAAARWQRGWDRRVAHINLGGEPFWRRLIDEAGLELVATRAMLGPEIIATCERWQLRHFSGVGKANLGNVIRAWLEGSELLGWRGPERATRRRSARQLATLLAGEPAEPGANLLFVAQRPA